MKEILVNQFDDHDYQNVEMLRTLGLTRNVAHVIVYMANKHNCRSKEIEIATGLRQPQISFAMKKIRSKNWLNETYNKKEKGSKGRPYKIYDLNISISDLLYVLQDKKHQEYVNALNILDQLRYNLTR